MIMHFEHNLKSIKDVLKYKVLLEGDKQKKHFVYKKTNKIEKIERDELKKLVKIYKKNYGSNGSILGLILGLKNISDKDLNLKITSTKWFISNLQEWNYKDKEKEFKFKLKNGEKKIFNFRKRIGIEEEKFEYFIDIDE